MLKTIKMITVKAYLYPNTVEVQVFDPSIFTTRNRVVYSRPIKVYQGIDNPIQIIIRNQDQKSVDLSAYAVSAQIQDPTNQVTINDYAVSFTQGNIQQGLGNFTLDNATISSLENRFYKLTFMLTQTSNNVSSPLYIDDNYGVPLDLEVLPAYYSESAPPPETTTYTFDGGTI
jgi:hypothetical protein